jgi:glycosyltransferase involved in cell wall biosynthesis
MHSEDAPKQAMALTSDNILVVIPAKDEAATISQVIGDIRARHAFDIVVIDDGSVDDTAAIARANGAIVLPHVRALGAWKATQTGIRYAFNKKYDGVMTMDADGQHIPSQMTRLLETAKSGSDVVIGSCTGRGDFMRHMAWRFFRTVSGINVRDITSGFRLYNLAALRVLSTKEATMLEFQDLGVLLLLRSLGLSIKEVEVDMDERSDGKSRIFGSWFSVVSYMFTTAVVCFTKAVPLRDVRYLKRFY